MGFNTAQQKIALWVIGHNECEIGLRQFDKQFYVLDDMDNVFGQFKKGEKKEPLYGQCKRQIGIAIKRMYPDAIGLNFKKIYSKCKRPAFTTTWFWVGLNLVQNSFAATI